MALNTILVANDTILGLAESWTGWKFHEEPWLGSEQSRMAPLARDRPKRSWVPPKLSGSVEFAGVAAACQ